MRSQSVTHNCCTKGCAAIWDIPADLDAKLRESGESFYCPMGHSMHYNGGLSAAEKQRRDELEKAKRRAAQAEREARNYSAELDDAALRTEMVREDLRKRTRTCPLCGWTTRRTNAERVMEAMSDHLLGSHNATRQPVALLPPGKK